jgi:hypothetical protein
MATQGYRATSERERPTKKRDLAFSACQPAWSGSLAALPVALSSMFAMLLRTIMNAFDGATATAAPYSNQRSVCSEMNKALSTSMPRYRTVLRASNGLGGAGRFEGRRCASSQRYHCSLQTVRYEWHRPSCLLLHY